MEAFVKSFADYRTIKMGTVLTRSLVLDSVDDEKSALQLIGTQMRQDDVGNWLIVDGYVYQISGVKTQNGVANLTLQHPLNAFSLPVEYDGSVRPKTAGAFMAGAFQAWVDCQDPVYAIPYLQIQNDSKAAFVEPSVENGGLVDLPGYCRLLRKTHGVTVTFLDAGNGLRCRIWDKKPAARQISMEDGRSQLGTAEYGKTGVAKLTVLHDVDTGRKDLEMNPIYEREASDWYLSADGIISREPPANRARGEWRKIHITGEANILEKVTEEFAKNKTGHKVEFRSELDLAVLDDCVIWLDGALLRSQISYKRQDSGDRRFFYKAGELATTAAEKLKGMRK